MIVYKNNYEEDEKLFSTGDSELDDILEEVYYSGIEDGYDYAQKEFGKKSIRYAKTRVANQWRAAREGTKLRRQIRNGDSSPRTTKELAEIDRKFFKELKEGNNLIFKPKNRKNLGKLLDYKKKQMVK